MVVHNLTDINIRYHLNTNLNCYHYTNMLLNKQRPIWKYYNILERLRKTKRNLSQVVYNLADIISRYPLNTSVHCYHYTNLPLNRQCNAYFGWFLSSVSEQTLNKLMRPHKYKKEKWNRTWTLADLSSTSQHLVNYVEISEKYEGILWNNS